MKKWILLFFTICSVLDCSLVEASENVIYEDDFDSYMTGTLPEGWEMIWNGAGNKYQIVTDKVFHSESQSLQIRSQKGWSSLIFRQLPDVYDTLNLELWMKSPDFYSECPNSGIISLYNPGEGTWGTTYGNIGMDNVEQKFFFLNNTNYPETSRLLDSFKLDRWYKIKLTYYLSESELSVWIDSDLILDHESILVRKGWLSYTGIALSNSGCGDEVFYFDDVKVWTDGYETSVNEISEYSFDNDFVISQEWSSLFIKYIVIDKNDRLYNISIFNSLGECVRNENFNICSNKIIDISNLPVGVYFININNIVKKLIKGYL